MNKLEELVGSYQDQTQGLACDIHAVPDNQKETWLESGFTIYRSVSKVEELANGFSFYLPLTQELLVTTAKYVSLDRLCCPFFEWNIQIGPNATEILLSVTGQEGAKELSRKTMESTPLLKKEVAEAAGFDTSGWKEISSLDELLS